MKTLIALTLSTLLYWSGLPVASGQSTAFTYQGHLSDNGSAANGIYDLRFTIYDSTNSPGILIAGPLTNAAASVSNGLFTVMLDFGAGLFSGADRWLDMGVRTNGSAGDYTTLTPRQALTAAPYALYAPNAGTATIASSVAATSVVQGRSLNIGLSNLLSGLFPTVAGGSSNSATFDYAVVAGGFGNTASSMAASIGGGAANLASGNYATVAGGEGNAAIGDHAFVGGGAFNSASDFDVVVGGQSNVVASGNSFIGNGIFNYIYEGTSTKCQAIVCGILNQTHAFGDIIGGGGLNTIQTNATASFIGAGVLNTIQSNAIDSVIGGGVYNTIQTNAYFSVIGGGSNNTIKIRAYTSTISGGRSNLIGDDAISATIGGGEFNAALNPEATISGGSYNTVAANDATVGGGHTNYAGGPYSTVAGGFNNRVQSGGLSSTIGGGASNLIWSAANYSTVGGGAGNALLTNVSYSTVGGGRSNEINPAVSGAVIAGGIDNRIQSSVAETTIGGGRANYIDSQATNSTVAGGFSNRIAFRAMYATIPGGREAVATNYAQMAYSGGKFQTAGDSQHSLFVLRGETADTNNTVNLTLDGQALEIALPPNSACTFTARVVGRALGAGGTSCAFYLQGTANNPMPTAGLQTMQLIFDGFPVANPPTVSDGSSNGKLQVQVTGDGLSVIRWTATIETAEVTF